MDAGVEASRRCAYCAAPIPPTAHARRRYCSDRCQWRALRLEHVMREDASDPTRSPLEWDGLSRFSTQPELRLRYRVYCISCGADEWLNATHTEVCAMRQLRPCERCGGTRWIEPDLGSRMPATMIGEAA